MFEKALEELNSGLGGGGTSPKSVNSKSTDQFSKFNKESEAYQAETLATRYKDPNDNSQYDVGEQILPTTDLNELRAARQPWLDKTANGLLARLPLKIASEVGKMVGTAYGIEKAKFTGNLQDIYDNAIIRTFDEEESRLKELFPIYTPKYIKDGSFSDALGSWDFYMDEGVDGLGFLLSALIPGGAISKAGLGLKGAKMLGLGKKAGGMLDLIGATAINTVHEAGTEAKGVYDTVLSKYEAQIQSGAISLEDAKMKAAEAAKGTFVGNVGVLIGPNLILNKMVFGKLGNTKSVLGRAMNPDGTIKEAADVLSRRQLGANILKNTGIGIGSEGFWEEGSQMAIEHYNVKKGLGKMDKGMMEGFFLEYMDMLGTTEGQKGIFLGALLGGGIGAIGGYRKDKQENKTAQGLHELFDSHLSMFPSSYNDLYEKDENGKIKIDPDTNNPVFDPSKVKGSLRELHNIHVLSTQAEQAALANDTEGFEVTKDIMFTKFAYPFLKHEGGIDVLKKQIDHMSKQEVDSYKQLYGEEITLEDIKQKLNQRAERLQKTYDNIENHEGGFFDLKMKHKDPILSKEEKMFAPNFIERLKANQLAVSSHIDFFNDRIRELTRETSSLDPNSRVDSAVIARNAKSIEQYQRLVTETNLEYDKLVDYKLQQQQFEDEFNEHVKLKDAIAQSKDEQQDEVDAVDEVEEQEDTVDDIELSDLTNDQILERLSTLKTSEEIDAFRKDLDAAGKYKNSMSTSFLEAKKKVKSSPEKKKNEKQDTQDSNVEDDVDIKTLEGKRLKVNLGDVIGTYIIADGKVKLKGALGSDGNPIDNESKSKKAVELARSHVDFLNTLTPSQLKALIESKKPYTIDAIKKAKEKKASSSTTDNAELDNIKKSNRSIGQKLLKKLKYSPHNIREDGRIKGGQSGWKIRFNIKDPKTGKSFFSKDKDALTKALKDPDYIARTKTISEFLNNYFETELQTNNSGGFAYRKDKSYKGSIWKNLSGGEVGESDFTIYVGSADDVLSFTNEVKTKYPEIYDLLDKGNVGQDVEIDDIFKGRIEGENIGFSGYHAPTNLHKVNSGKDVVFVYDGKKVAIGYGNKKSLDAISILIEGDSNGYKGVYDKKLKANHPELFKNIRNILGFQFYGAYLQGSNSEFLDITGVSTENGAPNKNVVNQEDMPSVDEKRYYETLFGEKYPEAKSVTVEDLPKAVQDKLNEIKANIKKIVLSKDGKKYVNTETNQEYERTTSYIADEIYETNEYLERAQVIGNGIDGLVRDFFAGKEMDHKNYSKFLPDEVSYLNMIRRLGAMKNSLAERGEVVISEDIVLYNDEIGVAGTPDLLTVDKTGVFRIYDMKTMRGDNFTDMYNPVDKTGKPVDPQSKYDFKGYYDSKLKKYVADKTKDSKREKHQKQLSLYRILLANTHGVVAKDIGILPIQVWYSKGDTKDVKDAYTSVANVLKGVALKPLDVVNTAVLSPKVYSTEPHAMDEHVIGAEVNDEENYKSHTAFRTSDQLWEEAVKNNDKTSLRWQNFINRLPREDASNYRLKVMTGTDPDYTKFLTSAQVAYEKKTGETGVYIALVDLKGEYVKVDGKVLTTSLLKNREVPGYGAYVSKRNMAKHMNIDPTDVVAIDEAYEKMWAEQEVFRNNLLSGNIKYLNISGMGKGVRLREDELHPIEGRVPIDGEFHVGVGVYGENGFSVYEDKDGVKLRSGVLYAKVDGDWAALINRPLVSSEIDIIVDKLKGLEQNGVDNIAIERFVRQYIHVYIDKPANMKPTDMHIKGNTIFFGKERMNVTPTSDFSKLRTFLATKFRNADNRELSTPGSTAELPDGSTIDYREFIFKGKNPAFKTNLKKQGELNRVNNYFVYDHENPLTEIPPVKDSDNEVLDNNEDVEINYFDNAFFEGMEESDNSDIEDEPVSNPDDIVVDDKSLEEALLEFDMTEGGNNINRANIVDVFIEFENPDFYSSVDPQELMKLITDVLDENDTLSDEEVMQEVVKRHCKL